MGSGKTQFSTGFRNPENSLLIYDNGTDTVSGDLFGCTDMLPLNIPGYPVNTREQVIVNGI